MLIDSAVASCCVGGGIFARAALRTESDDFHITIIHNLYFLHNPAGEETLTTQGAIKVCPSDSSSQERWYTPSAFA
jgi:hypothetical protein